MTTSLPFGTQLIGQTEKTLNAILDRLLASSSVGERQWVALNMVMGADGAGRDEHEARIASTLKSSNANARTTLDELVQHGFVSVETKPVVVVTEAGREFVRRLRTSIVTVTDRLWADLPADQMAVAGNILNIVLSRANFELASFSGKLDSHS